MEVQVIQSSVSLEVDVKKAHQELLTTETQAKLQQGKLLMDDTKLITNVLKK